MTEHPLPCLRATTITQGIDQVIDGIRELDNRTLTIQIDQYTRLAGEDNSDLADRYDRYDLLVLACRSEYMLARREVQFACKPCF